MSISELNDEASSIIERVEEGQAMTVTKNGRPVARIISTHTPPPPSELIADGSVLAPKSPRYLPTKLAKLRGPGKRAVDYVSEGRR